MCRCIRQVIFSSQNVSNIKFNIDSYGNEDNDTNIQCKLGWILGFRTGQYELAKNEDDNENIEKTIDLAEEKSERIRQTFIENKQTFIHFTMKFTRFIKTMNQVLLLH